MTVLGIISCFYCFNIMATSWHAEHGYGGRAAVLPGKAGAGRRPQAPARQADPCHQRQPLGVLAWLQAAFSSSLSSCLSACTPQRVAMSVRCVADGQAASTHRAGCATVQKRQAAACGGQRQPNEAASWRTAGEACARRGDANVAAAARCVQLESLCSSATMWRASAMGVSVASQHSRMALYLNTYALSRGLFLCCWVHQEF